MSESDSFEQQATDGISEQVDGLKGFLDDRGLPGGTASGDQPGEKDGVEAESAGRAFDGAVSAVASRWTAHGGDAPAHEPVAVRGSDERDDSPTGGTSNSGGDRERLIAPDGEEVDESGGSSDGSQSGQDAGLMS